MNDKDSVGMTELLRPSSREAFQLDFWQLSCAGTAELLADRGAGKDWFKLARLRLRERRAGFGR